MAPGFKQSSGCRPGMLRFRPQSGPVQRGVIKYHCADRFPPNTRHPERKRRISVHGVSDSWGSKYQSAGRHQTFRRQTSDIQYSRKQEGSGAFGTRVLSVMCCALTDGFGPGTAVPSGLVQREVIMPPVGGSRGAAIKLIARQGDTTTL